MKRQLNPCPERMVYSYPWGLSFTAYSTNPFSFARTSAVRMWIEFEYRYPEATTLSPPQVWLNTSAPENDDGYESVSAVHDLVYSRTEVAQGMRFVLSGRVYLDGALPAHDAITIRPQASGGWFSDVQLYAPLYRYSLECVGGVDARRTEEASCDLIRLAPGKTA
ncbi:hypothetical protein IM816_01680 [Luteibacter flocculans]|uniref:Uncharacterized protein n=1 Tax=Luteibacter flocculans TaxID=2780091 RepID=A0ABY4T422_9GAMM|nr:hypothetical protein [Luteibacter flocculans]URL58857.1 hypothetical protein IM816_01680 [Luteibacter flocculans]